jgi:hypothetical protein
MHQSDLEVEDGDWSPNAQLIEKVSIPELAADCRSLFIRLLGHAETPWTDVPVDLQHQWEDAVQVCKEHVLNAVEVRWANLAKRVMHAFYQEEAERPRPVELLWECVARHAVNVLAVESPEDAEQLRGHDWYADWLKQKLSQ